jgi:hypothetical protein
VPIFGVKIFIKDLSPYDEKSIDLFEKLIKHVEKKAMENEGYYIFRIPKDFPLLKRAMLISKTKFTYVDSTVCYKLPIDKSTLSCDMLIRRLEFSDKKSVYELKRISEESFSEYPSQYYMSPTLNKKAKFIYSNWIDNFCLQDNNEIFYATSCNVATGFIASTKTKYSREIVLNAVSSKHRRKGIYLNLCKFFINNISEATDCSLITISTQINNLNVQKIWIKLGFQPYYIFDLYHFDNT